MLVDTLQFINFSHEPNDSNSLSNNLCTSILEGIDGSIWVGTDAGLNRIDPSDFSIKRYLLKDGLIDEKIMSLLGDEAGNIWGSTVGHGIFCLNPARD